MNKTLLGIALAAVCGAATLAMPALAQQSATGAQASTATHARADQTTANSNGEATKPQRVVPPLDSRMCIRDTGSHIPPPKGQCLPVAGNSYTQQDIRRTGATNVGQALQMLDPSVTVHGH